MTKVAPPYTPLKCEDLHPFLFLYGWRVRIALYSECILIDGMECREGGGAFNAATRAVRMTEQATAVCLREMCDAYLGVVHVEML